MRYNLVYLSIFLVFGLLTVGSAFSEEVNLDEQTEDAKIESNQSESTKISTEDASDTDDSSLTDLEKTDEVDISDLQDEYWRPKQDELEVIQDKEYIKKGRLELGVHLGFLLGGGFTDSSGLGATLSWHFLERLAIEGSFFNYSHDDTNFLTSVKEQFNFTPDFNVPENQIMGSLLWTPIYAKFALIGKKISHFETYIGPSFGTTKTTASHFTWGTVVGERFFITDWLAFRVEWRMTKYTDNVNVTQGSFATKNGGPGFVDQEETKHNMTVGLSFIF